MYKKLSLIILFSCFLYANVAQVTMLRGSAEVLRQQKQLKAFISMPLVNKDVINTKEKTRMQISFSDNTLITLGSSTTFEVSDYSNEQEDKKINFFIPTGAFKLISGNIPRENFKLQTRNAYIGIRGTIFVGEIYPDSKKGDFITCLEGEIMITSIKTQQIIVLKVGQMANIKENGDIAKATRLNVSEFSLLNDLYPSDIVNKNAHFTNYAVKNKENNIIKNKVQWNNLFKDFSTKAPSTSIDDINSLIKTNTLRNYAGKINGTTSGTYKTKTSITTIDTNLEADMNLKIDFGSNSPTNVKITNQKSTITNATINNVKANNQAKAIMQQNINAQNLSIDRDIKTTINPNNASFSGSDTISANNLTSTIDINGNFKNKNAQEVYGNIKEHLEGSVGLTDITKNIDANFKLNKQ